jgi:hypothetical protein
MSYLKKEAELYRFKTKINENGLQLLAQNGTAGFINKK